MIHKNTAASLMIGLWGFSHVPIAAAAWDVVCTTSTSGEVVCRDRFPFTARLAIWGVGAALVLMALSIFLCVRRQRARSAAAASEYNVEANQVQGPPTIIATSYDPASGGASGVYEGPNDKPEMTGPAYPVAAQVNQNFLGQPQSAPLYPGGPPGYRSQPQTAPANRAAFADQGYPFSGYSPGGPNYQPRTAYVTGGFPRPLLAGRLKDRLKERPPSVSSVNSPK